MKQNILTLIKDKYADFGPTFLGEKLLENHNIAVSKETLRRLMINENIWQAKRQKIARVHQMRERRSCFGELIQIDGSPHDWFESRGNKCCLIVFIDDATDRIVSLRFAETETTAAYFEAAKAYITQYGLPVAFYSDRHSIFRVNTPGCDSETQFGRAVRELGIEIICARSAQAKGRVERANQTFQDRLVKEMRLLGISDIAAANAYLPEFMLKHNAKFAVAPQSDVDEHVKLIGNANLDLIFCYKTTRKLSHNLELSYCNVTYQIKTKTKGYRLRHAVVNVCEDLTGKVTITYQGKQLEYSCHTKQQKTAEIIGAKALNHKIDALVKSRYKPSATHPWRQPLVRVKITPPTANCNNSVACGNLV